MSAPSVSSVSILFGLATQAALLVFFGARRWAPQRAQFAGRCAYVLCALGFILSIWLAASDASWRMWMGPVLIAIWAVFGAYIDLLRKVEWRAPPRAGILIPYVALYFFGQMFLWWPLWDMSRTAWGVFTTLFVVNTALNLAGHFGKRADTANRTLS